MKQTPFCRADFNYIDKTTTRAISMDVFDGRKAENPDWQTCGFELMKHESTVTNWQNDNQIKSVHYAEIREFAKRLTGCDFAVVGGHIKRNPEQAQIHQDLAPITLVHSDFAESYGKLVSDYHQTDAEALAGIGKTGVSSADVAKAKRLVIIQFWRNVGPARMDWPIAFCDARSVHKHELVSFEVNDYAGGGFNFETLGVRAPVDEHHKWFVFPDLQQEEVVVFRTFDSDRILKAEGAPFWTPHSAFRDPTIEPGKPSRSSIELRASCYFM